MAAAMAAEGAAAKALAVASGGSAAAEG